ncbi:hypothetical protein D1867_12025 [Acidianus infernus]|uniref:AAA family ATPase n=1 Tax=Acidianus infernus TaxID=12915 RepID=A0A6A9QJG0_ACIIN|nr:ATP-binding protein [Acidianus infernus]MUM65943.1 hypothetical protein [Acidianus infernus]
MEELKRNIVKNVTVRQLRGFNVIDHEKGEIPNLHPRKINVIVGCNKTLKTTFLEALTVALLIISPNVYNVRSTTLASTLRMDPLWHYFLAKEGIDISLNEYRITNASLDEVSKVSPIQPLQDLALPNGFKLTRDDKVIRILRIDITVPQNSVLNIRDIAQDETKRLPNYRFVAFSIPNPISADFINNFLSSVSFASVKDRLKKLLNLEFIGMKPDEFGRPNIVATENDVEIQFLGSGFVSLILLTLASSNDIVIYDNIENHLHPQLMFKAIELMKESNSQWFITTQSTEFLDYLLTETDGDNVMVYEFMRRGNSIHIRQIEGSYAKKLSQELSEDLRGMC